MKINHVTHGNAPVNGKQLIFVHAAEQDHEVRDTVIQMIMQSNNGGDYAVLYNDDDAFPVNFGDPALSRINLFVPVITQSYLQQCGYELKIAQLGEMYGFDVLPVVKDADLIPRFNSRFGNIQAVTLTMRDPALEIDKLLSRMLVSAELIEEIIRDGFTRRLFLSYRKKDAAEVDRIMRAVHRTKWARAAAIWFDDFLVPGTDFESGINQAMEEADAVVFAVTNNLPKPYADGKKNYVCEIEYPNAVKLKKPCIAIETEPTPRNEIEKALGKEFPKSISVDNTAQLNTAFGRLWRPEPEPEPYIQYLRAMAYLIGVRVERDPAKAVDMLDKCVNRGVAEAAMQLSKMYYDGISVVPDSKKSVYYRQKAYDIVKNMPLCRQKVDWYLDIVLGCGGYGESSIGTDPEQADPYYERAIALFEAYKNTDEYKKSDDLDLDLYVAQAHAMLGSVDGRYSDVVRQNFSHYEKELAKAKAILTARRFKECDKAEHLRISAMTCMKYSSWHRFDKEFKEALHYADQAVMYLQALEREESSFAVRWNLAAYKLDVIGCELMRDGSWIGRFFTVSEKKIRDCIADYESLYAEKKDPKIACEMIKAYTNLRATTHSAKRAKAYWKEAAKRYREVKSDFPYDQELNELGDQIRDPEQATMTIVRNRYTFLLTVFNGWLGAYAVLLLGKPLLLTGAIILAAGLNFVLALCKPLKHLKIAMVIACIGLLISVITVLIKGGFYASPTDAYYCFGLMALVILI